MSVKTKTRLIFISIIVFGVVVLSMSGMYDRDLISQVAVAKGQDNPQSELRKLLMERKEVLSHVVQKMRIFYESGRIGNEQWSKANVELMRAELELCETSAGRIEVFERMVEFLTTIEADMAKKAEAGRVTEIEIDKAKAAVLQARIELARERMAE